MKRILQDPFRIGYQWWAPIELIRRSLLIVFIVIDPGNLVSIEKQLVSTYSDYSYLYTYVYNFMKNMYVRMCTFVYRLQCCC